MPIRPTTRMIEEKVLVIHAKSVLNSTVNCGLAAGMAIGSEAVTAMALRSLGATPSEIRNSSGGADAVFVVSAIGATLGVVVFISGFVCSRLMPHRVRMDPT
jgi:hypothetical protein